MSLLCASCRDKMAESQIAAQVGESVLTTGEVKMQMPLGLAGQDSAAFIGDYVERWVEEHLLYEQGRRNLPDIDQLEKQAEDYRRTLIAQKYENELLKQRFSTEISEEECQEFYNKHSKQIRLEQPIVQGVFVKILANSSKQTDVKKWLKQLSEGKTECIEEFEQFGTYRAADYDNFFDTWVSLYRLTDKLPETIIDAASFLRRKTYEMKDDTYLYLFVIKDFRLPGETAPYEFAKTDIYDLMVQQRWQETRHSLMQELKADALKSGLLKGSIQESEQSLQDSPQSK